MADSADIDRTVRPDIRTLDVVPVGEWRVAVAETAHDSHEAAVIGVRKSELGRALSSALSLGENDSDWYTVDDAPRVTHVEKYTAVGQAIERYLEQGETHV